MAARDRINRSKEEKGEALAARSPFSQGGVSAPGKASAAPASTYLTGPQNSAPALPYAAAQAGSVPAG